MKNIARFLGAAFIITLFVIMTGCTVSGGSNSGYVDTGATVTISPAATNLGRGGTYLFSATVTGADNPAQTVTWSIVQNNKHAQTTINANGLLTVSAEEPLNSLTIRATSTVDTTRYGEAIVTVTNEELIPSVNGVTVSPPAAQVAKGRTHSFSAIVTGANSPSQEVTWSIVQTNKHEHTTINSSGLLTIDFAENLTSLTVRARSTADNAKYGEATVTVTESMIGANCPACSAAVNTAVWHTAQEAACTETGTKELRCAGCHTVLDTDIIDPLGHGWDWVITIPATPVQEGKEEEKCLRCGAANGNSRSLPKIPGGVSITITVNSDGKMTSSNAVITDGVLTLKRNAAATLALENVSEYTNIQWRVQNTTVKGSGSSFTINGNNTEFVAGRDYFITVEALRNGTPYNVTITFKVEE